jgi:hypothetical protein
MVVIGYLSSSWTHGKPTWNHAKKEVSSPDMIDVYSAHNKNGVLVHKNIGTQQTG